MDNLIPIDQIIKTARSLGISFGLGDPKIHLAYLTKLRLLPQTIRRKISGKITGCYPESVIATLQQVEKLRARGLTYSQIKYQLRPLGLGTTAAVITDTSSGQQINPPSSNFFPASAQLHSTSNYPSSNVAFLLIGLFLGFLATTLNNVQSNLTRISNNTPEKTVASEPVVVSRQQYTSPQLIRLTSQSDQNSSEPIYLIAIPQQNFDRLGKININDVNKN